LSDIIFIRYGRFRKEAGRRGQKRLLGKRGIFSALNFLNEELKSRFYASCSRILTQDRIGTETRGQKEKNSTRVRTRL